MELVNTELNIFCPRKSCSHYQEPANPTWKKGTYPVLSEEERRQLFWCSSGQHKFSETSFSDLWHKHGSFKEYEQTAKLLKRGLAMVEIADVLQKDERTICAWKQAISGKSQAFHLWICCQIGIIVSFLQMDELWSYVRDKSRQLSVFAALDVPTRFWITLVTGKRASTIAKRLVGHVYYLGTWSKRRLLHSQFDDDNSTAAEFLTLEPRFSRPQPHSDELLYSIHNILLTKMFFDFLEIFTKTVSNQDGLHKMRKGLIFNFMFLSDLFEKSLNFFGLHNFCNYLVKSCLFFYISLA